MAVSELLYPRSSGRGFRVTRQRGQLLPFTAARHIVATVHPSSILRAPDEPTLHREMQLFIKDLRVVAGALQQRNVA